MKRMPVWDYSCVTREHYISLPNHEIEGLIKKYYFDMKSRTCGKIYYSFFVFIVVGPLDCLLTNLRGENL